ncbi:MAG: isovaleryl-CoA dehydrogenase, partial [Betaproteobacteria bacterium]|nr:isovaleryl-CoA dehydrogenase [Betaproteobacteria bacterium]
MKNADPWLDTCPPVPAETNRTHAVINQAPPLANVNLYRVNRALQEAVQREGAAWADDEIGRLGAELGSAEWIRRGDLANRNPPVLKNFDRYGERRDEFEFHPAWHECLRWLKGHGVDTGAWADPRPGAHVRRAALFQLFAEVECGSLCPTTMTYGAVPVVSRQSELARLWRPLLLSREYDERFIAAQHKRGVMMGMAMTEKQGGSDVRANSTRAEPIGGGWFRLLGHKWFVSATMCDAFLVTAQSPKGISCFFLPRILPDGSRNPFDLVRAKDKLGDRSNAGAEVELPGTLAYLVGEEGRGIPTVIEMATYTRLDCANGSTGIMRAALSNALHHASHREAFGKRLIDQALMRNVLADMALEVEAHTVLTMRVAGAFDRQAQSHEDALRRAITPVAKYWCTKRCPALVAESMEVLGGIGYIEEAPLVRLFRQSPLNAIWEGAGSIMALDLLRALAREPDTLPALESELLAANGRHPAYERFVARLKDELTGQAELGARRLIERLALALQASLLLRHAPDFVGEGFCASRLDGDGGASFGTLPKG